MTCIPSSILFAADVITLSPNLASCLAGRGHVVVTADNLHALLEHLQTAQLTPQLVVLGATALLGSRLKTVAALRAALKESGTTALLLSDLSEPLTAFAALAVGAHASASSAVDPEPFANLADLLLSERGARAVAATLRTGAAPQPSPRSDYPQVRASGF